MVRREQRYERHAWAFFQLRLFLTYKAAWAGVEVRPVDPAYTSRWGREHWLTPLQEQASPLPASGHHAAAVVIGRRALGHRARRRAGVTGGGQRTSRRRAARRAPAATRATGDGWSSVMASRVDRVIRGWSVCFTSIPSLPSS